MENISVIVGTGQKDCSESSHSDSSTSCNRAQELEGSPSKIAKRGSLQTFLDFQNSSVNQHNLRHIPLDMNTKCSKLQEQDRAIQRQKEDKIKELIKMPEFKKIWEMRNKLPTNPPDSRSSSKRSGEDARKKSRSPTKPVGKHRDAHDRHNYSSRRERESSRSKPRTHRDHRDKKSHDTPRKDTARTRPRPARSPSSLNRKLLRSYSDSKDNKPKPGRRTTRRSHTEKARSKERSHQHKDKEKSKTEPEKHGHVSKEITPEKADSGPSQSESDSSKQDISQKVESIMTVLKIAMKNIRTNKDAENESKIVSEKKSSDTTFHINFNVSSPKLDKSQVMKLPFINKPSVTSSHAETKECFSPTGSFSPCTDESEEENGLGTHQCIKPDQEAQSSDAPDPAASNQPEKHSWPFSDVKHQARLPYAGELSFWPSTLTKIDLVEPCTSKKAPVCMKCIQDNAHLDVVKDRRSRNDKYSARFTAWHMCCLCFKCLHDHHKFLMCSLPEELPVKDATVVPVCEPETLKPSHCPKSLNEGLAVTQEAPKHIEAATAEQPDIRIKSKLVDDGLSETLNDRIDVMDVPSEHKLSSIQLETAEAQSLKTLPGITPAISVENDIPYYYNANYCTDVTPEVVQGLAHDLSISAKQPLVKTNELPSNSAYKVSALDSAGDKQQGNYAYSGCVIKTICTSDKAVRKTLSMESTPLATISEHTILTTSTFSDKQNKPLSPIGNAPETPCAMTSTACAIESINTSTDTLTISAPTVISTAQNPLPATPEPKKCDAPAMTEMVSDRWLDNGTNLFAQSTSLKGDDTSSEAATSSDDAVNSLFRHLEASKGSMPSPHVIPSSSHSSAGCPMTQTSISKSDFPAIQYSDLSSESEDETGENTNSPKDTDVDVKTALTTSQTFSEASSLNFSSPKSLQIAEESETDDNLDDLKENPALARKILEPGKIQRGTPDILKTSASESDDPDLSSQNSLHIVEESETDDNLDCLNGKPDLSKKSLQPLNVQRRTADKLKMSASESADQDSSSQNSLRIVEESETDNNLDGLKEKPDLSHESLQPVNVQNRMPDALKPSDIESPDPNLSSQNILRIVAESETDDNNVVSKKKPALSEKSSEAFGISNRMSDTLKSSESESTDSHFISSNWLRIEEESESGENQEGLKKKPPLSKKSSEPVYIRRRIPDALKTSESESADLDFISSNHLRIEEESETDDNLEKLKKKPALLDKTIESFNVPSRTTDILKTSGSESADDHNKNAATDSSRDWSNPEWLQVDLPDMTRPRKRHRSLHRNPLSVTAEINPLASAAKPPEVLLDIKLSDRAVPFKKRKFSDISIEKLQELDRDEMKNEPIEAKLPIASISKLEEKEVDQKETLMYVDTEQSQVDIKENDGSCLESEQKFVEDVLPECTTADTNTNSAPTDNESGTIGNGHTSAVKCDFFFVKDKMYPWPYDYPTVSQIEALSDPDDSDDEPTQFCKPYIFLKRLEEDGFVPKCFVEDLDDHQCCFCCEKLCCSSSWVSIMD